MRNGGRRRGGRLLVCSRPLCGSAARRARALGRAVGRGGEGAARCAALPSLVAGLVLRALETGAGQGRGKGGMLGACWPCRLFWRFLLQGEVRCMETAAWLEGLFAFRPPTGCRPGVTTLQTASATVRSGLKKAWLARKPGSRSICCALRRRDQKMPISNVSPSRLLTPVSVIEFPLPKSNTVSSSPKVANRLTASASDSPPPQSASSRCSRSRPAS